MTSRIFWALAPAVAASALFAPAPVHAEGFGVEANYARANGRWGGEFGGGYALGIAGFKLTPGAGLSVSDDKTTLYGRVEATVSLPTSFDFGVGVRFSADEPRPYATLALPLMPRIAVKGNLGYKYASAGLTIGY